MGLAAAVGEGAADLLQPWPLKIVLDNLLKDKPATGWLTHVIELFGDNKQAILLFAAVAALVVGVVGAVCSYLEKYYTSTVGQWVMHDLRSTLYSRIQRLSLAYHNHAQTGDLISRVTSDIDAVQSFITGGLLSALINTLTLAGMIGVMFYMNWRFTLIALSVAPVLFLVVFRYTRLIKKSSREVRKKEGQVVSVIQEVLTSIRVVKAFAREDYEQKRLEDESLESVELSLRARSLKAKLSPLVEIIVAMGTSLVLFFGARMVLAGSLDPGSMVVFIWYLGKMYKPMQELSKMTDAYSKAAVGYERIREVLETDTDLKDLPGARPAPRFKGQIEFEHVTFSYEKEQPILKDVSFRIEAGQVAALVGRTGAGKSSIVGLVPRFYDPTSGVVKIDGVDIRKYTQKSIREQVSFVLQETLLFHAPVWKNIAYGKPNATQEEIIRAASLANADEFIDQVLADPARHLLIDGLHRRAHCRGFFRCWHDDGGLARLFHLLERIGVFLLGDLIRITSRLGHRPFERRADGGLETLPEFLVHDHDIADIAVIGQRGVFLHLVHLRGVHVGGRVLLSVNHAGLQRLIDFRERHHLRNCAERAKLRLEHLR